MNDKIYQMLSKMTVEEVIGIMWGALDDMQHYNGQHKNAVVVQAMGGAVSGDDSSRYTLPNIKRAKEMGKSNPLF